METSGGVDHNEKSEIEPYETVFTVFTPFPKPESNIIQTEDYLEASKGVAKFVELLGAVFTPILIDINGNIDALSLIYNYDQNLFSRLDAIVAQHSTEPTAKGIDLETRRDKLLWLTRALHFLSLFLQYFIEDFEKNERSDALCALFGRAYEETLQKHHNWFVRQIVNICLKAAPSRDSLLKLIAKEEKEINENLIFAQIKQYNALLTSNVQVVRSLYESLSIEL
ncbi:Glycolipid transfer protein-like protein [Dinothrombium tinctorium]|uniref:Glycolipid transfer protein-like protein n=1 Tax=Dinothrombium tinctorium TaxID=1965070 RepID=A0A3S3NYC4_9ACAR|nr:Glycolipid transfer protein-like protein [Dinothrombium tinctorium]